MTYIIKQDIAKLNKQIALLQQYVRDHRKNNVQANEHSSNVVVMLQSKLANTSMSFKDILEIRTQVRSRKMRSFFFLGITYSLNSFIIMKYVEDPNIN